MITEDFVSFETAKLLKEKGFDWNCITYYVDSEPNDVKYSMLFENNTTWEERCYSAPTHQMAMAWLREVYKIFIEIGTCIDLNGNYHFNYTILDKECKYVRRGYTSFDWNYEDAVEAALKYVLEKFDLNNYGND